MKMHHISRTLVATLVALSLAGSGSAWADRKDDQRGYGHSQGGHKDKRGYSQRQGGHKDKRSYGHSQGGQKDRRAHGRDRQHDKHYAYNKHKKYKKDKRHKYKGSYKAKHYRGHGGNNYYYKDDNSDEDLLIGLLVGGLIGYAINSSQDSGYDYDYDSYPQSSTRRDAQTAIYEADTRSNATCLQEREYQTKVIVGGRTVDAYGTACLQPDGSWKRSPAQVASF